MELDFDLNNVTCIEFGVGREVVPNIQQCFEVVPIDITVQTALLEMVSNTLDIMQNHSSNLNIY